VVGGRGGIAGVGFGSFIRKFCMFSDELLRIVC
jgi:hypothetical protein